MPQSTDKTLSNISHTAFRAELNSIITALDSLNSGATEPAVKQAYMFWADTTTGLLKQRNAANSAWINKGSLAAVNFGFLVDTASVIVTSLIDNLAVTAGKLATDSVETLKIKARNVTAAKIALKAITLALMADGVPGELWTWDASNVAAKVGAGTVGQVLTSQGAGAEPVFATPPSLGIFESQLFHAQDQKVSNTAGGTFTNGAERTRDLNTVLTNEITSASLATNQVSLPAGTYFTEGKAIAFNVTTHRLKLRDISNSIDLAIGFSQHSGNADLASEVAIFSGRFTLTGTTTLEMHHRSLNTKATNGFGTPHNFGPHEMYADIKIWKVS